MTSVATPRFLTVRVSETFDELFRDYEQALMRHAVSSDPNKTYSILSQRRKTLYEYIQSLEGATGMYGAVVRRFD